MPATTARLTASPSISIFSGFGELGIATTSSVGPTQPKVRDVTIADAGLFELYELRVRAIGKVAPAIAGEDIDGRPMKLGDHRGKVVVSVSWATWCSPPWA